MIQTARGPVDGAELGIVLPHEHLFLNMVREVRIGGLLNNEPLMSEELSRFASQGGGTIIDLTTAEITAGSVVPADFNHDEVVGRTRSAANVAAVKRVSERVDVNVVLGTGRYRDPYLDKDYIDRVGVAGLTEEMVVDLTVGFADTGVRAGIIGEIGVDKWYVSAAEERVLRAAARAHHQTGAAVYTHSARWPVAPEQLAILASEGVDLRRVAVGHVDTVALTGYACHVAKQGVFVGIDTINSAASHKVEERVAIVLELIHEGHLEQILISHDVCKEDHLSANGGNGFGFILGEFAEHLRSAGVSSDDFNVIVQDNPRRLLEHP